MNAKDMKIVFFNNQAGKVRLDVQANGGNVWQRQEQIADLFSKDRTVVGRHIARIFREGELDAESNVQIMHIPFSDKPVAFYSFDLVREWHSLGVLEDGLVLFDAKCGKYEQLGEEDRIN